MCSVRNECGTACPLPELNLKQTNVCMYDEGVVYAGEIEES